MPRTVALLVALSLAAACTCAEKAAAIDAHGGLRVPLPDGWKATAVEGGLHVGPGGQVMLELESTTRELPTLAALVRILEQENVTVTAKESTGSFVGVRYSLGKGMEGFLGVRQVATRTVWCATTREASDEALQASMEICRALSWDP